MRYYFAVPLAPPLALASPPRAVAFAVEEWHGFGAEQRTRFVDQFWQKAPLLIRGLLSPSLVDELCCLTPDDVLQLACEPGVRARLIQESGGRRPWQLTTGPLDRASLRSLPAGGWTVLVQEVDTVVPQVEALRERFDFVPRWWVEVS